jgi:hypothetical protein
MDAGVNQRSANKKGKRGEEIDKKGTGARERTRVPACVLETSLNIYACVTLDGLLFNNFFNWLTV